MNTFMIVALLILVIAAYIHTFIRLIKILPQTLWFRTTFCILYFGGIVGYGVFLLFGNKIPLPITDGIYTYSTSWVITLLYLLLIVLFIDLFQLINSQFKIINKEKVNKYFNRNRITTIFIFGLTTALLVFGYVIYFNKKRIHFTIETNKPLVSKNQIRIVAISDLHLGYTISRNEALEWVELINSEKPDIVIIGGDIIDNDLRPVNHDSSFLALKNIKAPMGVYACLGNHEYQSAVQNNFDFSQARIKMLIDSVATTNGITIIGRDDLVNVNRKSLKEIIPANTDSSFTILLDHQPLDLNAVVEEDIDFQFSGHTHNGQVFPLQAITNAIYEVGYGYKKKRNTQFYVSSGLGIWGGKFRVFTRSEYIVIDLVNNSK
ncbi:MAG: metallophosphoesterase [Dysgonamonadaceae bacterium]|nr:metallophosphoesterase [Dysgonamonadaceae bacterium]MDD3308449.1 metallophosphoesterase [Dysgonamonadaceae bacterium]MDD3899689.1 metallophosphoesterase [Dysgonamonadaceae bacterium]MDD4398202.1 metallophosphoesterase [Dysgonamonadaceae bacterium]MEA5081808.1 metallophosphoesterase [Dysgonamonadaceae bacterium]